MRETYLVHYSVSLKGEHQALTKGDSMADKTVPLMVNCLAGLKAALKGQMTDCLSE